MTARTRGRAAAALLALALAACAAAPAPAPRALGRDHRVLDFAGVRLGELVDPGAQGRARLLELPPRLALPAGATFESRALAAAPFREALVSWNAVSPDGAGFAVDLAVRRRDTGAWSPWLRVGEWGSWLDLPERPFAREFDGGRIDVDHLAASADLDALRVRVSVAPGERGIELRRVTLCLTGPLPVTVEGWSGRAAGVVNEVPPRSQRLAAPELAPRVCSPTSVAMVLAARGVRLPTETLARELYDARHDIYGNWTRAVQGAFAHGVPGYLRRFAGWGEVERLVASGALIVASVRAEPGELAGAPYASTEGHLLVVAGFDARGDVVVYDPAAGAESEVRRTYRRDDVARTWLAKGGAAYVFPAP